MNFEEKETLKRAVLNLGGNIFEEKSYRPKVNAQENMRGVSYFCDEKTLKFFGARITYSRHFLDGFIFGIVESRESEFKFHLFDSFGERVVSHESENVFSSTAKAKKALFECVEKIDHHYIFGVIQDMIHSEEKRIERAKKIFLNHGEN